MVKDMPKTKVHPVAEFFPMMSDEEYAGLKEDIKANGQQEPVCYWRNELIDGRNRLRACEELGVKVEWWELSNDDDPIPFILSKNLHRRHLSTSQRAMVAAKIANLGEGRPTKLTPQICGVSTKEAATTLTVSTRSVETAKQVIEHGSKAVQQAVEKGKLAVSVAAELATSGATKEEQTKLVKQGKDAVKAAVTVPKKVKPSKPEKTDSPQEAAKKVKSLADQYRDKLVRAIDDYHQHIPNARERDRLVKVAQSIVLWGMK